MSHIRRLIGFSLRRQSKLKNAIITRHLVRFYCIADERSRSKSNGLFSAKSSIQTPSSSSWTFITEFIVDHCKWLNSFTLMTLVIEGKKPLEDPIILLKGLLGARLYQRDLDFINIYDEWWKLITKNINYFTVEAICEIISLLGDINVVKNRELQQKINGDQINFLLSKILQADFTNKPPRAFSFIFQGLQRLQSSAVYTESIFPKELIIKTINRLNSIHKNDIIFEEAAISGVLILNSLSNAGYSLDRHSLQSILSSSKILFQRISSLTEKELKDYFVFNKLILVQNRFAEAFLNWQIDAEEIITDVWNNWFDATKNLLTMSPKFEILQNFDLENESYRNTPVETSDIETVAVKKLSHRLNLSSQLAQLCASSMDVASRFSKLEPFTKNGQFKIILKEVLNVHIPDANPMHVSRFYKSLRTLQTILKVKSPMDDEGIPVDVDLLRIIRKKVEEANNAINTKSKRTEKINDCQVGFSNGRNVEDHDRISKMHENFSPSVGFEPPDVDGSNIRPRKDPQRQRIEGFQNEDRLQKLYSSRRSDPPIGYQGPSSAVGSSNIYSRRNIKYVPDRTMRSRQEGFDQLSPNERHEKVPNFGRSEPLPSVSSSSFLSRTRQDLHGALRFSEDNERNLYFKDDDLDKISSNQRHKKSTNFHQSHLLPDYQEAQCLIGSPNVRPKTKSMSPGEIRDEIEQNLSNIRSQKRQTVDRNNYSDSLFERKENMANLRRSKRTIDSRWSSFRNDRDNISSNERRHNLSNVRSEKKKTFYRNFGDNQSKIQEKSTNLHRSDPFSDQQQWSAPVVGSCDVRPQPKQSGLLDHTKKERTFEKFPAPGLKPKDKNFDEISVDASQMQISQDLPFTHGEPNVEVDSWRKEFDKDFNEKFQTNDVVTLVESMSEEDKKDSVELFQGQDDEKDTVNHIESVSEVANKDIEIDREHGVTSHEEDIDESKRHIQEKHVFL